MNSCTEKSEAGQSCELIQNLDILREIPFFSGLSLECLKLLAYLCAREVYSPGEALFHEGDDDGRAYYVVSGSVDISREADGKAVSRPLGPGEFLGGLSLLGPMPRLYAARAVRDTVCLVLPREKFNKTMAQFPEQMPRILQAAAAAVRAWDQRLCAGGLCPVCQDKAGVSLL